MVQFLPPDMVAGNLGAPGASGQPSQLDGSQYSHPTSDAQAAAAAVQHAMPEYDDALLADTLVSDDQGASASFHSNGAGLPDFLAASPPRSITSMCSALCGMPSHHPSSPTFAFPSYQHRRNPSDPLSQQSIHPLILLLSRSVDSS